MFSIWPIEMTQSGATILEQSWSRSDGNESILRFPQTSKITEAIPSYCLVSYQWHLFGEFYPSAEMQSVNSTARDD